MPVPTCSLSFAKLPGVPETCSVFISYAQADQIIRDRALAFAELLELWGISVEFDQYEHNPEKGWAKWMEDGIDGADYVILLCTPEYRDRVREVQPNGTGLGVVFESSIVYGIMASQPERRHRFVVVQFDKEDLKSIPTTLRNNNRYTLAQIDQSDASFERLYRLLTNQPEVTRPDRGPLRTLPPKERTQVPRSGAAPSEASLQMVSGPLMTGSEEKRPKRPGKTPGRGDLLQRLARQIAEEAEEALYDDRLHDALRLARETQRLDGRLKVPIKLEADALYSLRQWGEAAAAYERFQAASKFWGSEYDLRLHIVRYRASGSAAVREMIEAIADSNPHEVDIQVVYANFLDGIGERTAAKANVRARIKAEPDPDLLEILAIYEWKDGNVAEAVALLEEAIQKDPADVSIWSNLGVGRAEMRRFGLAIEALRKALELRPRYQFARFALAEVYALMGDVEAMAEPLRELVKARSHNLPRLLTERTFESVRDTKAFQDLLASIPPELLRSGASA